MLHTFYIVLTYLVKLESGTGDCSKSADACTRMIHLTCVVVTLSGSYINQRIIELS